MLSTQVTRFYSDDFMARGWCLELLRAEALACHGYVSKGVSLDRQIGLVTIARAFRFGPHLGHGGRAGKVVRNSVPRIEAQCHKRKMRNLRARPSMMKAVARRTRIYRRSASKIVVLAVVRRRLSSLV